MIKAVLFDLDGTLYDRDTLAAELVRAQYAAFKAELGGLTRNEFVGQVLQMDDHGYGEKAAGYADLVRRWKLDPELAARLETHFWSVYGEHCRLSDDTRDTLAALRRGGKRLGVITNGHGVRQREKLTALGLDGAFDAVLISELEGVRKPHVEIFRRALERCGVAAEEALFVGDHPHADVEGALGAGMQAAWKQVPYWRLTTQNAVVIDKLADILPYCLDGASMDGAKLAHGGNP